ncbi:MAG: DUF1292 domain-containing protein [Oscillospiraceae bacterium]|nr:DUF1292 domain-containing protein [Oscillospiraceae bacterium]
MSDEYGSDIITLTDDEGQEYELEHLDTLEHGGTVYMAFIPADTPDDEAEVDMIILKAAEEDGEEILATLDSDEEMERVYELFMQRLSEDDDEET